MNRRDFLMSSIAASAHAPLSVVVSSPLLSRAAAATGEPRVAVLLVDTDRIMASIDKRIYGHFLEHIKAGLMDSASLEHPDAITPVSRTLNYAKDLTVDVDPYTVAVIEIRAE